MSEQVQIGAILDSISTRKDKSIKIVFETNEVSAQEAQIIFSMRDSFGWLSFSPSKEAIEVPEEPPPEFTNQKSYSQRLRACLYRLWEQKGTPGDSESFYREHMEKVINWVKDRLEPDPE